MISDKRQLILGSTSAPRRALLERLLISFEVEAPDVDETPLANETPEDLVVRLAKLKAHTVAKKFPDAIIIGADQVGVVDEKIIGKPMTYENCVKQLEQSSGKEMQFFIGLCILDARTGKEESALERFDVLFRNLSHEMIESYLQKETPLHCAGSCKAEGLGIALIEEFRGHDYTALVGLPLIRLVKMLEKFSIDPLSVN